MMPTRGEGVRSIGRTDERVIARATKTGTQSAQTWCGHVTRVPVRSEAPWVGGG